MSFDIVDVGDIARLEEKMMGFQSARSPNAPGAKPSLDAGSLATRRMSDIESKQISWLWPQRIARGKLTIIAGNPGLGKSQVTASIAAVVSTGGRWPVDGQRCDRGDVIFLSAEDDPADTLRPRLEAAGADLTGVHVVDGVVKGYAGTEVRQDRAFTLQSDLQALDERLSDLGEVALVVIDPISAYLGDTDSHKNAEVRSLLTPLAELASRHNVAIIGVSHLNKAAGTQALMRVLGSVAFVAAARAAYLVAADPEDKSRRLLLPLKNNIGPDTGGLAFKIEGATVPCGESSLATSKVVWESEAVNMTADDVVDSGGAGAVPKATDEALGWLTQALSDGPVPSTEIFEQAEACGISRATLRRASKRLGVVPKKSGFGGSGGWAWSLKVLKDH